MDNLEVGSIVTYRLLPRHLPRDPARLWLGEITKVTPELIYVTSLEPGYEGQEEDILVEQVINPTTAPTGTEAILIDSVQRDREGRGRI